jgi:hypothetical protein
MHFDVFNGDADGICALHQLRLAEPVESTLVTGVKRDISLLKRVEASAGDRVTVLDIAMSKNLDALNKLLERGVAVAYFDHHIPGDIPNHPNLKAHVDTSAEVCTSLLVDKYLAGKFRIWAVTAAFGDNLHDAARRAAQGLNLSDVQLDALCELGECLNYNGYGETVADLFFAPDVLYRIVHRHVDPFTFIHEEPAFQTLKKGYAEDMALAQEISPVKATNSGSIYLLPEASWSRRISGVFSNALATGSPDRATAVLTGRSQGGYVVSVRAPIATKTGADEVCSKFETGGGRKGAAGINLLPEDQLEKFIAEFYAVFG